jgi:hypothetical protein
MLAVLETSKKNQHNRYVRITYLEICKISEGVTLYVCGYARFCVFKLSNCANCRSIVKDFKVENSGDTYFASLQRGGLCLPSNFLIFIFLNMYAIFQYFITNSDLQNVFLKA